MDIEGWVGGSRVAQRREDMGKLALEVQIPADDQSDKFLRVTEEEKGISECVGAAGTSQPAIRL